MACLGVGVRSGSGLQISADSYGDSVKCSGGGGGGLLI